MREGKLSFCVVVVVVVVVVASLLIMSVARPWPLTERMCFAVSADWKRTVRHCLLSTCSCVTNEI